MVNVGFDKAIRIAEKNARALISTAKDFELEGIILSKDKKLYEVLLSYEITGEDPLTLHGPDVITAQDVTEKSTLYRFAQLMRHRRQYKTFLVTSEDGQFIGFKKFDEN